MQFVFRCPLKIANPLTVYGEKPGRQLPYATFRLPADEKLLYLRTRLTTEMILSYETTLCFPYLKMLKQY